LRRVADALHARIRIVFETTQGEALHVAESGARYRAKRLRKRK
jgi:hypothetical protein